MGEVANLGRTYRSSIIDYKSKYFNDRAAITWFTKYMIAIINNCDRFEELALEVKQRWWKSSATSATSGSSTTIQMSETISSNFESVLQIFAELRKDSANYLLDEAFMDIEVHFTEILSSKWSTTTVAVDTICATLDGYCGDYAFLRPNNFEQVISEARDRVARRYITAVLVPPSNVLKLKKSNF